MTPEERQLLSGLFDRIRDTANQSRDREADGFINDAIRAQPHAPYVMSQTIIVMEQTLKSAASRIEELEAHVKQLEEAPQSGSFLGGIGKSIFGGAEPQRAPSPQPVPSPWNRTAQQPQGYQAAPAGYGGPAPQQASAPWQQPQQAAGGGFLKGALGAAAGVAGGVMLANSLSGMFGGHQQQSGFGGHNNMRDDSSVLDHRDSGARSAMSDQQSIDDGLPSSEQASYDNGNDDSGGYSDDSTDV